MSSVCQLNSVPSVVLATAIVRTDVHRDPNLLRENSVGTCRPPEHFAPATRHVRMDWAGYQAADRHPRAGSWSCAYARARHFLGLTLRVWLPAGLSAGQPRDRHDCCNAARCSDLQRAVGHWSKRRQPGHRYRTVVPRFVCAVSGIKTASSATR
eukprot:1524158-Rhodomonas_salina.4